MRIADLQALAAEIRAGSYNGRLSKTQADRLFGAIENTVEAPPIVCQGPPEPKRFVPAPAPVRQPSAGDSLGELANIALMTMAALGSSERIRVVTLSMMASISC